MPAPTISREVAEALTKAAAAWRTVEYAREAFNKAVTAQRRAESTLASALNAARNNGDFGPRLRGPYGRAINEPTAYTVIVDGETVNITVEHGQGVTPALDYKPSALVSVNG